MEPNYVFRIASESDAFDISTLVNSVYRGESGMKSWTTEAGFIGGQRTDPDSIKATIKKNNHFFLLMFEDNRLVGSVNLEKQQNTAYLGMLSVDWRKQNSGYGRALMSAAENYSLNLLNCTDMKMHVISIRKELIDWYVRRGYTLTEERADFPYGDLRFGQPLIDNLEFVILRKKLGK